MRNRAFIGMALVNVVDRHAVQVYTLEKVLKVKKDTVSQTVFLDEAMKVRICRLGQAG